MRRGFLRVRELLTRHDAKRARRLHTWAATRPSPAEERERDLFEREMRVEPGQGRVVLARGRTRAGEAFCVGMPTDAFTRSHGWITGGTGTGKTFEALAIQLAILHQESYPCVYFDMKGEFAALLLDVVLPALAVSGAPHLQRVRVIRPFDGDYMPLLRVTRPEHGVSREVQSMVLASQLRDALGEDLGGRMLRVFLKLVALAIELDESLVVLSRWLAQPETFVQAATRSQDPELRQYAWGQFKGESKLSVGALAARLDTFLHLPETRLALSAPSCLSFAECLEGGVTVIDLGDPPAGAEHVARFWSGILVGRLARAILSREVKPDTAQVHVVLDEWQEALATSQIEQFVRLLSLARYKRVALTFVNQAPAQVAEKSPLLVRSLRTNCNWTMTFRSNLEDARAMAHSLPLPEERKGGRGREELVEELTRLPDREALLWVKQAPFRAQRVRSPRVDIDGLRERAAAASDGIRAAIRQGTVALRREDQESIGAQEQDLRGVLGLDEGGADGEDVQDVVVPNDDGATDGDVPDLLVPGDDRDDDGDLPAIG